MELYKDFAENYLKLNDNFYYFEVENAHVGFSFASPEDANLFYADTIRYSKLTD
jgi:hypothetical protein